MTYVLAIDPGKHACGVALFTDKVLTRAELVKGDDRGSELDRMLSVGTNVASWVNDRTVHVARFTGTSIVHPLDIAVEWPQVYLPSQQVKEDHRTNPNDLLGLTFVLGAALSDITLAATHRHYMPHAWKGSLGKRRMNNRAFDRLSVLEQTRVVDAGELTHNVFDAIGIGLHHLGRLERKRVIAR